MKPIIKNLPQLSSAKRKWWERLISKGGYIEQLFSYLDKQSSYTEFENRIDADLRDTIRQPLRFGFGVILFAGCFFLLWGTLAPLDSASIAEGTVIVSGNRKTVQHLEGGVIREILVQDGQNVAAGQVLLKLNDSNPKAQIQMIKSQLNFVIATQERLNAENQDMEELIWSKDGFDFTDPEMAQILKTQENLFEYRKEEMVANRDITNERISQSQKEIESLKVRQNALIGQQELLQEELASTEQLFAKGLALRPRMMELKRAIADVSSAIAETKARIAAANETISENKLKLLSSKNERQKEILKEIKEVHSQLLELLERYNAVNDILERTEVKAPVDGIVTDLRYHTVGGVIQPGQKILDIIPRDTHMIIESKVKVQDIDSLHPGLVAKVQLGAYKSRLVPRLDGKVFYVSADAVVDQHTGQPYYVARIEIDEKDIANLTADIKLYPGMPATVFIVKGTRSFLSYLISPIMDSFYRAFKEK